MHYKHLDDTVLETIRGGRWVPSIPLPYYKTKLFARPFRPWVREYGCGCGETFATEVKYQLHYRTEQLLEMNTIFITVRNLQSGKATFWRRATFIYQNGTPGQISDFQDEFNRIGWPEGVNYEELDALNKKLMRHWAPIYDVYGAEAHAVIDDDDDEDELEDETPEQAKADFAEPFTHVNSKGVTYYLNMKRVTLRAGKEHPIWYFSHDFRPETAQRKLPDGYTINENPRNGFVTVRRTDNGAQADS